MLTQPTFIANSLGRLSLFSFIVFFTCLSAYTQEAQKLPHSKFITRFPFILTGRGIIIIKAKLGDFPDTLNFILDTGCGGISLDSGTAKDLHLTAVASKGIITGISQKKAAAYVMNQQLHLPGLTVDQLDFHVNDYSFLTEANRIKIDGIIGFSFLTRYIIKIDYETTIIEVWKPGTIKYPGKGYVMAAKVDKLAALNVGISDSNKTGSNFFFDTGAEVCFLVSSNFIRDSNVFSNHKKLTTAEAEGLGGKQEMMLTAIHEVRIGPYRFNKVPAYIYDDPHNVFSYPQTSGVIGNELMQRFNVILNYPQNEIHLLPNALFNHPFNYAYPGCSIGVLDGKLLVKNIMKNSPADIAGLQNDDIIFGINDNFKNDINEYTELLYKTGAKLKVYYVRNNQVKFTIVEIRSILD